MNIIIGFIFATLLFIYFFPAIVAISCGDKHKEAIAVLNLFLGWTFLGWLISLVWALADQKDKKCEEQK